MIGYFLRFLFIAFLFSQSLLIAQQPANPADIVVEVSKEKLNINGKNYYLHMVKKGENVYRIGKAYNIPVKDIIMANPDAISGAIKERQILKIPAEPMPAAASPGVQTVQNIESDKFIYHVTEDQQTVFFITQKYKVSKEDLYKYNPELEYSTLQVGQVVRVPKIANAPVEHEIFRPIEGYTPYTVKKKDTMYSIAKANNVTIEDIESANPDVKTNGLKADQVIQIPQKSKTEFITAPSEIKPDTSKKKVAVQAVPTTSEIKTGTLNVVMLLPLFVEENETLVMIDSANAANNDLRQLQSNEIYQRTLNILEFYQGALLALDSLKQTGISVHLQTYDTGKELTKLKTVLTKPELKKADLIIGPFYTDQVEFVADFAYKNQIYLVSPVSDSSKVLKSNPYVFQILPNERIGIDGLVKYVSEIQDKNIVMISSGRDQTEIYRSKLNAYCSGQYSVMSYSAMPISDFLARIEPLLSKEKENIVILPTDNKTSLTDLVSKLVVTTKNYSIRVVGSPAVTIMENIDQESLHVLQYHYYSVFYSDFDASNVKRFLSLYRQMYSSEPYYHATDDYPRYFTQKGYNFGMLGYDIAFSIVDLIARKPAELGQLTLKTRKGVHSEFKFERSEPLSGYLNKNVGIVGYDKELKVVKAK